MKSSSKIPELLNTHKNVQESERINSSTHVLHTAEAGQNIPAIVQNSGSERPLLRRGNLLDARGPRASVEVTQCSARSDTRPLGQAAAAHS